MTECNGAGKPLGLKPCDFPIGAKFMQMGKYWHKKPLPDGTWTKCDKDAEGNWLESGFHTGVDFKCPVETPIRAYQKGQIIHFSFDRNGYGKYLVLRHTDCFSIYCHLTDFFEPVNKFVEQGKIIAISGNTGNSSGPHLHFEVRQPITALWNKALPIEPIFY